MEPAIDSWETTDGEVIETAILSRRRCVRAAIAGGIAALAIAAEAAFHGADAARRKPATRKQPPIATSGSNATGSSGSNAGQNTSGMNTTGGNNSGTNGNGTGGTGTNAGDGANGTGSSQTGAHAGGDIGGSDVVVPPSQGGNSTGTSITCTTRGAIVDANNPANNRPAERVCATTP